MNVIISSIEARIRRARWVYGRRPLPFPSLPLWDLREILLAHGLDLNFTLRLTCMQRIVGQWIISHVVHGAEV